MNQSAINREAEREIRRRLYDLLGEGDLFRDGPVLTNFRRR